VHVVVDPRPPEREPSQPELRLPPSPHDATGGGCPWLLGQEREGGGPRPPEREPSQPELRLPWLLGREREGGGGGEESRAREDDTGGEGSEIRVGVGWVVGVLGKVVGWWEGFLAKASGGACKNDTNIEFSLLSVEIRLVRGLLCKCFECCSCAVWTS
jgi:hypothetical protein